ncbi:MAG: DUF4249 family protein [Salinivirgaceae bacterium]|nr:DUF4249 family protein [Salinivirgaceae bacterium]
MVMIALTFLIFTTGCQEPYLNTNLNANEHIPVFNGLLTNIDKLNTFKLTYAAPYTQQQTEGIAGAIITIEDQNNRLIQLKESGNGVYKLPNGSADFSPENEYIATIILADGSVIKSEPIFWNDTLPLANVFFDFNIKTSLVKNSAGEYINVNQEGIFVKFKLQQPKTETVYYRVNADYYVHSQKWISRVGEYIIHEPHYDIVYEIRYDTLYDIYEGFSNVDFPVTGELFPYIEYDQSDLTVSALFLPADNECRNFSNYTEDNFIEWLIPIDLYHTSEQVHNYYSNVAKQLGASGQIFDPIPDQIIGNMHNETDPSEPVLGLFDVVSVNRKYLQIYVYESLGYRSYQSKTLSDTVIKQGWYPNQFYVDTVFIDSLPVNN